MNRIITGLRTDLDCLYEEEGHKIDVYTDLYWKAETKEQYEHFEDIIFNFQKETELFKMNAWCDVSGWDYWHKQEEGNYVAIDVVLKKQVESYTEEEIQQIEHSIKKANKYFSVQFEEVKAY